MIVIYHDFDKVTGIQLPNGSTAQATTSIPVALQELATTYADELIAWCYTGLAKYFNADKAAEVMHKPFMMHAFSIADSTFLGNKIGFVELSPFIHILSKKVAYPTWQISGYAGVTSAKFLQHVPISFFKETSFSYFLQSVAKTYMPQGLFCYSQPGLLQPEAATVTVPHEKATTKQLYSFVANHYKANWVFMLFLNTIIYHKKLQLVSFFSALKHKKNVMGVAKIEALNVYHNTIDFKKETIDVIIPTIGRKQYLYHVLKDLAKQTYLPVNVIIVEQNPLPDSVSELDYITNETWPFTIQHVFTHQTGACNARNIALSKVTSDWVFLNDDDNRFDENLLELVLKRAAYYQAKVITTTYLKPNEINKYHSAHQTTIFGSGNSFIRAELMSKVAFDMKLEFGYGEDYDFGMQLRSVGADVIYVSNPSITHLRAPMGGFRTKFIQKWENDKVQPKPSPTVMYGKLKNHSHQQLLGYKTVLFLKEFKRAPLAKKLQFVFNFNKKWNASINWAKKL